MKTGVEIVLYDSLSPELRKTLITIDEYHSNFFWHNCAEEWHGKYIHKVYALVSEKKDEIFGFFSLRVNNLVVKKENIPIIDISFIDVSEEILDSSARMIFRSFLEFTEKIALELSRKVGCRYIRSYIPFYPSSETATLLGRSLAAYLEDVYKNMNYFEPDFKEKEKIRKIKDKRVEDQNYVLILKYLLRDLRIKE